MSIKKVFQEKFISQIFPFCLETQFMDGGKFDEPFYDSSVGFYVQNACLQYYLYIKCRGEFILRK